MQVPQAEKADHRGEGYSAEELLKMLEAFPLQLPDPERRVQHLSIDTRRITFPINSLFVALVGPRRDGHDFLQDAYRSGVRQMLISRPVDRAHFPHCNLLQVPDTLQALQQLAARHRRRFDLPLIGITGSNGKTIVKEWLFQLLHPDYQIVRSPRSYNSQIGVPLSVWNIQPHHTLGIFEAGISRKKEMEKLSHILRCDIGIFTNLGAAHDEGFADRQEKLREKCRLFDHAHTIVYCRDQEGVEEELSKRKAARLFSWSMSRSADLQITLFRQKGESTQLEGRFAGREVDVQIPFSGHAAVENAIHCWAVLLLLECPDEQIRERMKALEPVAMRLELKAGLYGSRLINDSYNSDLNGLEIALDFLQQHAPSQSRVLILSDLLQSGLEREDLYRKVAQLIQQRKVERLIGIGREIATVQEWLSDNVSTEFFPDTSTFLSRIRPSAYRDAVVLIKGARAFRFEQIVERLSLQAHRTTLEVDLDAILGNLQAYTRHLGSRTATMAVVKASAYGSGSAEVARLLEFHKVDYLAVAYADEGVELRREGVNLPILVLNTDEAGFPLLRAHRLEPEIYSLKQLRSLIRYLAGATPPLAVQLMLDTGMHRLGFEPHDLPDLLQLLEEPSIRISGVFSHLVAADDPAHDAFTHRQAALFLEMYETVSQKLGYRPPRHLLNTAGIIRFPEYQFEMVRLGIGLYGIDNSGLLKEDLRPALSLRSHLNQIRLVQPGETVGYNRHGRVDRPTRIGTVAVGYADGLPRLAGNGRYSLLVRGRPAPIVGDVCMDMCMVDLSAIPEAEEGDEVVVFGADHPVKALAAAAQTIPYEIFTDVSPRVKRVYIKE